MNITIASRASALAMEQSSIVACALESVYNCSVTILPLHTRGDILLDTPLASIGGKGLFIQEVEEALLDGRADIAVHSMKDMPSVIEESVCIGVFGKREDPRDIFLSEQYQSVEALPAGAVVGTSSLRRQAQILAIRPDITVKSIRGNITTRIAKLVQEHTYDAIILAYAGVKRLGVATTYMQALPKDSFLPAFGQGALCIEYARSNKAMHTIVSAISSQETTDCITAERSVLFHLNGGCHIPIAGHATITKDNTIRLEASLSMPDGTGCIRAVEYGERGKAMEIGEHVAHTLRTLGGDSIVDACTKGVL